MKTLHPESQRAKETTPSYINSKVFKDDEHRKLKQGKARRFTNSKSSFESKKEFLSFDENPIIKYKIDGEENQFFLNEFMTYLNQNINQIKNGSSIIEEDDFGDTEYKLKLIDSTKERINQLTTQMKFRIQEGQGEAFYKIGYQDNGFPLGLIESEFKRSLVIISYISKQLSAETVVIDVLKGVEGSIFEVTIRKIRESISVELRIMLLGNSSSGKSTLVHLLVRSSRIRENG